MTTNGHQTTAPGITAQPFPASRKIFLEGRLAGVRVPMREIALTPTKSVNGGTPIPNEPIVVYDTSGPYTDPSDTIDLRTGLAATSPNSPMSLRIMGVCARQTRSFPISVSTIFANRCVRKPDATSRSCITLAGAW